MSKRTLSAPAACSKSNSRSIVDALALALGIGLGLLPRARPHPLMLAAIGALLVYAGWTALSLLWTESAESTTAELVRVLDYVALVVLLAAVIDRRIWRPAAMGVGSAALFVCALAVASRLDPSAFPVDHAALVFRSDRLDYPFGYWNAVGAWAAMSVAIGLAWSSHDPGYVRRALALALVPVACLAAYLTYSRASVAAVALAVVVVLVSSRDRVTATIHVAIAAAGSGLAILAVRGSPQIARATGTGGAGRVVGTLAFASAACAAVAVATRALKIDGVRVPRPSARRLVATAIGALVLAGVVFGAHLAARA